MSSWWAKIRFNWTGDLMDILGVVQEYIVAVVGNGRVQKDGHLCE